MIQADPRKTIAPIIGVVIATLLLVVWHPNKAAEKTYYTNQNLVFGTTYTIRYEATKDLGPAIEEALTAFDNSLSMFNPHSILSAINANRDTTTNEVFEAMFAEATRVHTLSGGAFDITVAPLVNYWGFGFEDQKSKIENQQSAIDSLMAFVGFNKVQLIDHHIVKTDPRMMIDAGAVAKGQACDVIAQVLRDNGCENYLVEIGGEVVAHGVNAEGKPWGVGICKPNLNNKGVQDEYQEILRLTDACLATSGNYRNFRTDEHGHPIYGHTIDPRVGHPVQRSVYSATVISSSCMRADALATACMVLGADEALNMIDRAEDAACLLIVAEKDSLTVLTSPKWEDFATK